MKCVECKERSKDSDAQWLLLDKNGYEQIRPLCHEHCEETCHVEGEENLDLVYLGSEEGDLDLERLVFEVNSWLSSSKKRIEYFASISREPVQETQKTDPEKCEVEEMSEKRYCVDHSCWEEEDVGWEFSWKVRHYRCQTVFINLEKLPEIKDIRKRLERIRGLLKRSLAKLERDYDFEAILTSKAIPSYYHDAVELRELLKKEAIEK